MSIGVTVWFMCKCGFDNNTIYNISKIGYDDENDINHAIKILTMKNA